MKYIILTGLLLYNIAVPAQSISKSVIAAEGHTLATANMTMDWTIGETVIGNPIIPSYIITEGFHSADSSSTNNINRTERNAQVFLYPNPVKDQLYISITQTIPEYLVIYVTGLSGNVIYRKANLDPAISISTSIDFSNIAAGTYFVMIYNDVTLVYSSKIIKQF